MLQGTNTNTNMRKAALQYVRMGLPIIPLCPPDHSGVGQKHRQECKAPGKAPVLANWTHRGLPEVEEVEAWFNRNPNYNLGLILGDTGEYNLVGIDIDGSSGERLLEDHAKGVLPPTWEFVTGKGRRLIYMLPEGAPSKKQAVKGDDGELAFLATGQQTVMPPSIHQNGSKYEWVSSPEDIEIADAPQWLLNIILVQEEVSDGVPGPTVASEDWNKKLSKGERNNHLTKLAGSLIARRNIPKEQILSFLLTWNRQNCVPPLPDTEIEVMIENLHEVEHTKAAAMRAKKGDKEVLRPYPFAVKFIKQQKKEGVEWRYCVGKGLFYRCDVATGPWESVDVLYLQKELRKALIEQHEEWDAQRNVSEVITALREYLADPVNDDIFDIGMHPDVDHVYVGNGILEWRTLELKEWTPASYSTIKLQAVWDPDIKDSPIYDKWEDTLRSWLPDKETRDFLQEFVGYCLIPDCSYRTAVFLYGPGSNGKSLFLEVIAKLFHGYISFVPLHWVSERFESSKLMDKLINVCGDIDSKYMTETSTLKAMIAGDPIRAEFKHGKSFHFHPVCRLMFSANQLPRSSDKSEGWYSRWKFIEFPNRFKTDTAFKRKLMAMMSTPEALSVLLYWAVEGLRRLYNVEDFTVSEPMQVSENQYRLENDTVQAFVQHVIQITGHTGKETLLVVPSIYAVYREWCNDHGVKPVSQHEFTRRCGALDIQKGVRVIRGGSANCLLGVRFTKESQQSGYMDEYLFNENVRVSTIKKRPKIRAATSEEEVEEGSQEVS